MTNFQLDLYQEMLLRMGDELSEPDKGREGWLPGQKSRGKSDGGIFFGLTNALSQDFLARDANGHQDFYSDEERLVASLHFCFLHLQLRVRDGAIFLSELDEPSQIVQSLCKPVFSDSHKLSGGKFFGYDMDEDADFLGLYTSDYRIAELLREKICVNVLFGFPMPKSARDLAYKILCSQAAAPFKAKPSMVDRDTLFRALAKRVNGRVGLPLGEGKMTDVGKGRGPSSALVVRSAFFAFGIHLNRNNSLSLLNKGQERERDGELYSRILSPTEFKSRMFSEVARVPMRFRFEDEMRLALAHLETEKSA